MGTLERDLIQQFKDCFFELFDDKFEAVLYENFIKETMFILIKTFCVEAAAVYKYIDWNQEFELAGQASTHNKTEDHSSIPLKELKNLVESDGVLWGPLWGQELAGYNLLVEINKNNHLLGFIAIKDRAGSKLREINNEGFKRIGHEYGIFFEKVQNLTRIIKEEKKYKELYRVTEKFHASMDIDNLLGEIIITLKEIYPAFSYYLLLSQDHHNHNELPIRDLEYDNENRFALKAYVTGTVQLEDSLQRRSTLYAPLKGKQGNYGVLVVNAPNTLTIPQSEVEFITLLAKTAGSALENTQLYLQSRKLITDLQLINETTHWLNSNLRLTETIHYMSEKIIESFRAQEVGFFLYSSKGGMEKILEGSTPFFSSKEAWIYIDYIREKIKKDYEPLFSGDFNLPQLSDSECYHSIMAIPMDFSEDLKGISIVLHQNPYFFSFEMFKLLQSLIHHSTLALTNSMLREELEKMIITDHLTRLHSRTYLDENIKRSMMEDEQGAFILIDIDDFKKINDSYGHQIGDEVLIQLANIIKSNIRENDTGARWGGEELAIYLPKVTLQSGLAIAKRLVEKIAEDSSPHITISCGVSCWHKEGSDAYNYLFKRADDALYIAKRTGKNKVVTQEDGIAVT